MTGKNKEANKILTGHRLGLLFESAPDLIQIVDKEGRFLYVNKRWQDVLGYSRKEAANMGFEGVVKKSEISRCQKVFADMKDGEGFTGISTSFVSKSGKTINVVGDIGAVFDKDGFMEAIGVFRTKDPEKSNSGCGGSEKDRYRRLVENQKDIILSLSPNGRIIYCSPAIKNFSGYDAEEEVGESIGKYFAHKSELLKVFELMRRDSNNQEPQAAIFRYKAKDGAVFPVEVNAQPFVESGKVCEIICVMRDVSDREKVKFQVKESEEKYRQIFNNINDALYLHALNPDGSPGKFLEVNDVACRMLGYSREELTRMSPQDIDAPEKKEEVPKVMEKLFAKGSVTFEMRHIAKNGKKIDVELNSHLFELAGEKRILTVARDITKKKQDERELKEKVRQLETFKQATVDRILDYKKMEGENRALREKLSQYKGQGK